MIKRPLFLKSLHVIIAKLNHNPSPRHCCLHVCVCVCGCVPPGDSMAMALVQRRTPDAHNFLFPRRHPISGLEIMELRDDPRNSLNRPDIYIYIYVDTLYYTVFIFLSLPTCWYRQFYTEGICLEELRINIHHAQVLLSSSSKPWAELPEDVRPTLWFKFRWRYLQVPCISLHPSLLLLGQA